MKTLVGSFIYLLIGVAIYIPLMRYHDIMLVRISTAAAFVTLGSFRRQIVAIKWPKVAEDSTHG